MATCAGMPAVFTVRARARCETGTAAATATLVPVMHSA